MPHDLESLVVLPGVGRKTANVVLGTAFGIASGVVVDTHVGRLSNRLGLSSSKDPVKIEQDLMRELPSAEWIAFSHRMIQHGRRVCMARNPQCDACAMADICPRIGVAERVAVKGSPASGAQASRATRKKVALKVGGKANVVKTSAAKDGTVKSGTANAKKAARPKKTKRAPRA